MGKSNDGVFGSSMFLLCTLLKCNYAIWLTDVRHSGTYASQIRDLSNFLQKPVMKRKFFRVGQVNRSQHYPLRSGHNLLALKEV